MTALAVFGYGFLGAFGRLAKAFSVAGLMAWIISISYSYKLDADVPWLYVLRHNRICC